MISYNNSDIIQCLRQYDMFANSLKLVYSEEEKQKIIKQLNKLLEKNLNLTNEIYEEEYKNLSSKETSLLDEEKTRLTLLIELINQRISYVEKLCQDHYQLTKDNIDYPQVAGYDILDELENKIRIIDKYTKNEKTKHQLEKEIQEIDSKISLAKEKNQINESLNKELEKKLITLLDNIFKREEYKDLMSKKEQVISMFDEISYLYNKSEENVMVAREKHSDYLIDCQSLAIDMKHRYKEIDNTLNIINLMEFYKKGYDNYDDLLFKREKINDIMTHIIDDELIEQIKPEIDKQYITIRKEEQDEKTYVELINELNKDKDIIEEIDKENNSPEFQTILGKILENEKRKQQLIIEEENRKKEEERQRQQEIEKRRQEEISKRQKLIEESRKKDIEQRTKQMLEEQNNSVLNSKKDESGFTKLRNETKEDTEHDEYIAQSEIERELFEEFKKNKIEPSKVEENTNISVDDMSPLKEEKNNDGVVNSSDLPKGSLDDYIKSFDDDKINDLNLDSILGEDFFPTIPE